MNPYASFVDGFVQQLREGAGLPLGGFPRPDRVVPAGDAPRVLIFSPHPDDEVIIGGLALRLGRELGWNVINVAVTQGSNKARQAGRWAELKACCDYIGFGLVPVGSSGLEGVTVRARKEHPVVWAKSVEAIAAILRNHQPRAILFPHDDDWNGTHIGTHHLVVDALKMLGPEFECVTVETEFWGDMRSPNLLIELSSGYVMDLIAALSFHVGEVTRNPYHLRLPAWLVDNVRRGGELVGGQGGAAPDFPFGTLYRLRRWKQGGFVTVLDRGRFVSQRDSLATLF